MPAIWPFKKLHQTICHSERCGVVGGMVGNMVGGIVGFMGGGLVGVTPRSCVMQEKERRVPPRAKLNFPKTKTFIIFRVQDSFSSDTDAAAGAAATAAATAAASAPAFVFTTVFTVVATVAAAEAAAVAAVVAAAPAAASVSEEKILGP